MQELVKILVYHHQPKIKLSLKKNSVPDYLLFSNHSVFLDEFSVPTHKNKVCKTYFKEDMTNIFCELLLIKEP